jgi:hypothetical protein
MQECSLCDLGIIYILFTQFNDHAPFEFHSCFSKQSIVVIIIMRESFILRHSHLLPLSLTVVYKEKVSDVRLRFSFQFNDRFTNWEFNHNNQADLIVSSDGQ